MGKKIRLKNNKSILRTQVGILAKSFLIAILAVTLIFVILLVWFGNLVNVLLNLLLGEKVLLDGRICSRWLDLLCEYRSYVLWSC